MSLKRDHGGGTPSGSRVHRAFKSPLRVPGSAEINTFNMKDDINNSSLHKRTRESGTINRDLNTPTAGCSEVEIEDSLRKQVPHKLNSKKTYANSLIPNKIAVDRSPRLPNSCRRKMTPRHFNVPFRSPCRNVLSQHSLSPEDQLAQLYKREVELDEEITSLEKLGYKVEELQGHIENLHRYNEIKDAAQLAMGRLAELDGVTTKEIHERYNVSMMD